MVVLTIVGMVGLAAMLSFISSSESMIPKPCMPNIMAAAWSFCRIPEIIELPVEVITQRRHTCVKASVALSGMSTAVINITDSNGTAQN